MARPEFVSLGSVKIPDASRGMGVRVVAGKGSGKSRLIGRTLIIQDFAKRIPTLVIDPTQALINNVLDKIIRMPPHVAAKAFARVRYINLAGEPDQNGIPRIVPFPLLYRARTPYEASQRFPDVIERIDPALRRAPILGMNQLRSIATDTGSVLYTLGWQFSEAEALLLHAKDVQDRIERAVAREPSIGVSASYLLNEYPFLRPQEQDTKTASFLSWIRPLSRDPVSRSVYCAGEGGLSWHEMVEKRLLVLIDVSKIAESQRKFAMQWIYQTFIDYVRIESGMERTTPISLVIDELANMLGNPADNEDPMAQALTDLLDVYARNYKLWVTLLHQEENQTNRQIQLRLNGIGTQILGITTDPDTAVRRARRYNPYDPNWIRREETVWGSRQIDNGMYLPRETEHFELDTRPVEYSIQEQLELNSRDYLEIRPFSFKIGVSKREGHAPTTLQDLTTESIDPGEFPQMDKLPLVRASLMGRDGKRLSDVLTEIDARMGQVSPPLPHIVNDEEEQPQAQIATPYGLKQRVKKRKQTE